MRKREVEALVLDHLFWKGEVGFSPFYTFPLPLFSMSPKFRKEVNRQVYFSDAAQYLSYVTSGDFVEKMTPPNTHMLKNYLCTLKSKYRTV